MSGNHQQAFVQLQQPLDPRERARQAIENARAIRQQALDAADRRSQLDVIVAKESEELNKAQQNLAAVTADVAGARADVLATTDAVVERKLKLLQMLRVTNDLLTVVDSDWDGDVPVLANLPAAALKPVVDDCLPELLRAQLADRYASARSSAAQPAVPAATQRTTTQPQPRAGDATTSTASSASNIVRKPPSKWNSSTASASDGGYGSSGSTRRGVQGGLGHGGRLSSRQTSGTAAQAQNHASSSSSSLNAVDDVSQGFPPLDPASLPTLADLQSSLDMLLGRLSLWEGRHGSGGS